jgi:hypothetical protein
VFVGSVLGVGGSSAIAELVRAAAPKPKTAQIAIKTVRGLVLTLYIVVSPLPTRCAFIP